MKGTCGKFSCQKLTNTWSSEKNDAFKLSYVKDIH